MNIETQFNIGDKVWFYIEEYNRYTWGKIEGVQINAHADMRGTQRVTYTVNNRHFDKNHFMHWSLRSSEPDIKTCPTFNLPTHDIFSTVKELKHSLNQKHANKMVRMTELKKRWF